MTKKYELLEDDTIKIGGRTLYHIRAVKDFGEVKKGDIGGYIEKEDNLSHEGDCWVCGNACVYGKAKVGGQARIYGDAKVYDDARIG